MDLRAGSSMKVHHFEFWPAVPLDGLKIHCFDLFYGLFGAGSAMSGIVRSNRLQSTLQLNENTLLYLDCVSRASKYASRRRATRVNSP
jgi:hypothetical protein